MIGGRRYGELWAGGRLRVELGGRAGEAREDLQPRGPRGARPRRGSAGPASARRSAWSSFADVAAAAEAYARRRALGEDAMGKAHAIKIDALARLGGLLAEMPKATGTRGQLDGRDPSGGYRKGPQNNARRSPPCSARTRRRQRRQRGSHRDSRRCRPRRGRDRGPRETLTEARRRITHAARPAVVLPVRQYGVLYADPPWQYRDTRPGLGDGQRVNRAAKTPRLVVLTDAAFAALRGAQSRPGTDPARGPEGPRP